MISTEEFKAVVSMSEAALVSEIYVNDGVLGVDVKVAGSLDDVTRMLGSLCCEIATKLAQSMNQECDSDFVNAFMAAVAIKANVSLEHQKSHEIDRLVTL